MSPTGVLSLWPRRPGEVPNTTLPPEKAWLTGVTWLDSPPITLSTHTRSRRFATCSSEPMPTEYLKSPTPRLYIHFLPTWSARGLFARAGLSRSEEHTSELQ